MKEYLVGGAVRDKLLGNASYDNDYVVVGSNEASMLNRGFSKVGAHFPVFLDPQGNEWALARKERKTGSGYQGFDVVFDESVTLEEDLFRRDLTINAIAFDVENANFVDPYNGIADLQNKVLRHVSEAFVEDPLRVVRLARFFARWQDFTIAPETFKLAQEIVASGEMNALSDERFWAEIEKMYEQNGSSRRFFMALHEFGVLTQVDFFKDLFGDFDTNARIMMDRIHTAQEY